MRLDDSLYHTVSLIFSLQTRLALPGPYTCPDLVWLTLDEGLVGGTFEPNRLGSKAFGCEAPKAIMGGLSVIRSDVGAQPITNIVAQV